MGSAAKCSEVTGTFQLPFKTTEEAVAGTIKSFGMSVCEDSGKPNVTEKVHNLLLSGLFLNLEMVLVRAAIGFSSEYGCVLKVTVRSLNQAVSRVVLECVN